MCGSAAAGPVWVARRGGPARGAESAEGVGVWAGQGDAECGGAGESDGEDAAGLDLAGERVPSY